MGRASPNSPACSRGRSRVTTTFATLLRAQLVFWMLAATDGHAKNFSLRLLAQGRYRLTPLYDLLSFLPYHQRRKQLTLAMPVAGRRGVDEIRLRHWQLMAERCGYPPDRAIAHVRELTAALPDFAATVSAACRKSGLRHPIIDQIVDGIANNAKRVTNRG